MKTIPSNYLAAIPEPRRVRPVGSQPNHCLYSLEDQLVVLPLSFDTAAGALSSPQVPEGCYLEDQGSGVLRLYHPKAEPKGVHFYLGGDTADDYTVNRSTAAAGYTDIDFGVATASWQGYLALRGTHRPLPMEAGGIDNARDLASRSQQRVSSLVPGLCITSYTVRTDGSGDPDPDNVAGPPLGSDAFFVEHPGPGLYLFHLTVEIPDGATFVGGSNGRNARCSLQADRRSVLVETFVTGTPTDSLDGAPLGLCILSPTSQPGRRSMTIAKTEKPVPRFAYDGVMPMSSLVRDQSFIPVSFHVDGSGDVDYAHADTVVPDNVYILRAGNDYFIQVGIHRAELAHYRFIFANTGRISNTDLLNVATTGTLRIHHGAPIANGMVTGFILASFGSER